MLSKKYLHPLELCVNISNVIGHISKRGAIMVSNSKNKDKIVRTAIELFRSRDYFSVTVKDICRSAGVSASSFYSVFSGKDDILLCILRGHKDDFEATMLDLLNADTELKKLWVLYSKFLKLVDDFGPELTIAMFELEINRKFSFISSVKDYIERYSTWLVRLVEECQKTGVIQNPGKADTLVPMAVRLSFYILLEWCVSEETYSFAERAYLEMEHFYVVREDCLGQWHDLVSDAN